MKPDICIHHAPCQDGYTAAWAIWKRWPDVIFAEGVYGQAPPDVAGKRVLIVDFSYKHDVLVELAGSAAGVTILDHHKSAAEDLRPFAVPHVVPFDQLQAAAGFNGVLPIQALFDMDQSGARMAWEYAHGAAPPPWIVKHVEDRDLWRFVFENTRAVTAELFSRPYDFATWDDACNALEDPRAYVARVEMGEAIERKHHKDVGELLKLTTREMVIGGQAVPVANLPYTLASDAANLLAEGAAFGACYYDNSDGRRVFSLRSKIGGADVSQVASAYGGGGHARAAGFSAAPGWEGDR